MVYAYCGAYLGRKLVRWWRKVTQCVPQCTYIKRDLITMPTATLTYDLADPDEAGQHRLAIAAIQLHAALHGIDECARAAIKWGEHPPESVRVFEEIRSLLPNVVWEY